MRHRIGRIPEVVVVERAVLALWIASALALPVSRGEAPPAESPPSVRAALHEDTALLERALLDVTLALSRGDGAGARAGLDRMETACRRASRNEELPREVYHFDVAFHATLDRARELALAGDIEHCSQQFFWLQGACRKCHDEARKNGVPVGPQGASAGEAPPR